MAARLPCSARLSTREEDHHRADAGTLVPSKIPSGRGGRGEVSSQAGGESVLFPPSPLCGYPSSARIQMGL